MCSYMMACGDLALNNGTRFCRRSGKYKVMVPWRHPVYALPLCVCVVSLVPGLGAVQSRDV
jgi:hypothetical protein